MTLVALVILSLLFIFLVLFGISLITTLLIRVPYVPSDPSVVEAMLRIASLDSKDRVYDLGCGDGRLVHEVALRYKIPAIGYEISILPYLLARLHGFLRKSSASIYLEDFFGKKLDRPTVIFTYLTPVVMVKLEKKLIADGYTGLRIISHGFGFPTLEPHAVHRIRKGVTIYEYKL